MEIQTLDLPNVALDSEINTGELVRTTGTKSHPFADLRKVPSKTSAGNTTGYGIELAIPGEEDNTNWELAGTVSKDYLIVKNKRLVQLANEMTRRSPFAFEPQKLVWDGKRMIYTMRTPELKMEVGPGDEVCLGLMFKNSYNGSLRCSVESYVERLICANGMTSKDFFFNHSFRHLKGEAGRWEEELEETMQIFEAEEDMERFVGGLKGLAHWRLSDSDLRVIRRDVIPDISTTRFGQIIDEYMMGSDNSTGYDNTGYDFLNAATRVLWHRDRSVTADYNQNDEVTTNFLRYAFNNLN